MVSDREIILTMDDIKKRLTYNNDVRKLETFEKTVGIDILLKQFKVENQLVQVISCLYSLPHTQRLLFLMMISEHAETINFQQLYQFIGSPAYYRLFFRKLTDERGWAYEMLSKLFSDPKQLDAFVKKTDVEQLREIKHCKDELERIKDIQSIIDEYYKHLEQEFDEALDDVKVITVKNKDNLKSNLFNNLRLNEIVMDVEFDKNRFFIKNEDAFLKSSMGYLLENPKTKDRTNSILRRMIAVSTLRRELSVPFSFDDMQENVKKCIEEVEKTKISFKDQTFIDKLKDIFSLGIRPLVRYYQQQKALNPFREKLQQLSTEKVHLRRP